MKIFLLLITLFLLLGCPKTENKAVTEGTETAAVGTETVIIETVISGTETATPQGTELQK